MTNLVKVNYVRLEPSQELFANLVNDKTEKKTGNTC